jgi:hypothetical protein
MTLYKWLVLHGFMCLSTFVIFLLTSKSPLSCYTSVACAVDPSVTTSSTDFPFQNLVLWDLSEFSVAEIIQYSRTFGLQRSWNQAHTPLLIESFPKTPRT